MLHTYTFNVNHKGNLYTANVTTPECQSDQDVIRKAMESGEVVSVTDEFGRVVFPEVAK